jgi:uncharacterized MAPEG superfamily protein
MASTVSTWLAPRLPTLSHICVSTLTWPLMLGVVYWLMPAAGPLDAPVDRFLFAVQWCVAPTAVLSFMILGCMRIIDTEKAEDPFAGAESRRFLINQRVIQNTVEQMAYFLPALLALSVRLDPAHTRAIPVLVVAWCIARVVFWVGYQLHPDHRSLGFGWTQNTAMLAVGWFVATLV